MSDLMNRLAKLHDDSPRPVDDDAIAADLHRGHVALRARRRRRAGVAGVAAAGLAAAGVFTYANTGNDHRPAPRAGSTTSRAVVVPPSTHTTPKAVVSRPKPATPAIKLVAYHGRQLPGYTVEHVPEGYVLQGISGSVLDIAEQGDHSSLDSFAGKLVVMLNDTPAPKEGTAVTVDGHPGYLRADDGVMTLAYSDGTHNVAVQAWSNIHLTPAQLISFAEGVTVLPSAQVGHG